MNNNIDEEKLREAKAKLACHIEPPKGSPYAQMLAADSVHNEPAADTSCGSSSCGTDYVPDTGGKIRLTEMTSAGG